MIPKRDDSTTRCGPGRGAWTLAAVAVLLGFAPFAAAQSPTPPADYEELRSIVDQLEHPLYAKREEATHKLAELIDRTSVDALYVFLEDSRLSSEQIYRILHVYNDKVINRPSGALGISMDPQAVAMGGESAVRVVALLPGMPAEKVLKIDDRIRRIDNKSILNSEDLRWYVQSKQPGDRVLINVDRPKVGDDGMQLFDENNEIVFESIQVELELGSVDQLTNSNNGRTNVEGIRQSRIRRVQATIDQFAPKAKEIGIRNRDDLYESIVSRPDGSTEVDEHPIIQIMLSDVDRIVRGQEPITVEDRNRWDAYQRQLSREFADPKNTRQERDFVFQVIQRFLELRPNIEGAVKSDPSPSNRPPR